MRRDWGMKLGSRVIWFGLSVLVSSCGGGGGSGSNAEGRESESPSDPGTPTQKQMFFTESPDGCVSVQNADDSAQFVFDGNHLQYHYWGCVDSGDDDWPEASILATWWESGAQCWKALGVYQEAKCIEGYSPPEVIEPELSIEINRLWRCPGSACSGLAYGAYVGPAGHPDYLGVVSISVDYVNTGNVPLGPFGFQLETGVLFDPGCRVDEAGFIKPGEFYRSAGCPFSSTSHGLNQYTEMSIRPVITSPILSAGMYGPWMEAVILHDFGG